MHPQQKLQIKQLLANRDQFQLLVTAIPELQKPICLWTNRHTVAENVAFGDWGLPTWFYHAPHRSGLRVIYTPDQLRGQERGKILWECYGAWDCRDRHEISFVARERGMPILPDTEFFPWLYKRIQETARPVADDTALGLELARKLRSLNDTNPTTRH